MLMRLSTTPAAARHIMAVTPRAMIACCPRLRKEKASSGCGSRRFPLRHLLVVAAGP